MSQFVPSLLYYYYIMEMMIVQQLMTNFESYKHNADDGLEFWFARDIMPLLGYKTWQKFEVAIQRAQQSCITGWQHIEDHFLPAPVKTPTKEGWRPKTDYLLTRYACYLIAQNGDPRKQEIAHAQMYFASQTRKQELYQQRIEENKRLEARAKLKETESKIEETIYHRGVSLPSEFATFKNKKIEALYQMSTVELKKKRNIPKHRALADFDSEVELKAKDFVYAMTDHNIKEQNIKGKEALETELIDNAKATRDALVQRWIIPEQLPPQQDLKLIEKQRQQQALWDTTTPVLSDGS